MPLILHTSDTHLGYAQFDLREREDDVYQAFNEIIETAVKDRVDAVVHAGDIFHVPKPAGRPLVKLAEGIKTLADRGIKFYFTLGEHDISRVWGTPSPYIFHKLGLATYVGTGEPIIDGDLLIAGFHKRRRNEMDDLLQSFRRADDAAKQHPEKKKVAVIHQGLYEFNKWAGEITGNDLPSSFNYYAMGHYHDHLETTFDHCGGPVCYPGSIDPTSSEGIKEFRKGFLIVDLSSPEAEREWIELRTSRKMFRFEVEYARMKEEFERISKEIDGRALAKEPVILLMLKGADIDNAKASSALARFRENCLYSRWEVAPDQPAGEGAGSVLQQRPADIVEEMFKQAAAALGSEERAIFAIRELLPLLGEGKNEEAAELIARNFETGRFKSPVGTRATVARGGGSQK